MPLNKDWQALGVLQWCQRFCVSEIATRLSVKKPKALILCAVSPKGFDPLPLRRAIDQFWVFRKLLPVLNFIQNGHDLGEFILGPFF